MFTRRQLKFVLVTLTLVCLAADIACETSDNKNEESGHRIFTVDELAQYDGQNVGS